MGFLRLDYLNLKMLDKIISSPDDPNSFDENLPYMQLIMDKSYGYNGLVKDFPYSIIEEYLFHLSFNNQNFINRVKQTFKSRNNKSI